MDNRQHLIIRVGAGSLSFLSGTAENIAYHPYALNSSIAMAANMREALRTMPMLSNDTYRTLVMVDSPVLMIPVSLFDEKEQDTLYRHAFTRQEQQTVMNTVLPDLNSVAVFSIQKDMRNVIDDTFGSVRYLPVCAPVWRHLHDRSYTGQRQKLYGYFHDRRLDIFSFAQMRFRFYNSYAVDNAHDALYFLLAVWKSLGLAPDHDELHLAGDFADKDELSTEVQKYVKRVFFINPSGEFNRAAITQVSGIPYDLVTLYIKGR